MWTLTHSRRNQASLLIFRIACNLLSIAQKSNRPFRCNLRNCYEVSKLLLNFTLRCYLKNIDCKMVRNNIRREPNRACRKTYRCYVCQEWPMHLIVLVALWCRVLWSSDYCRGWYCSRLQWKWACSLASGRPSLAQLALRVTSASVRTDRAAPVVAANRCWLQNRLLEPFRTQHT